MKEISKRSTFAVLFYINKAKRKKNGLCPLMGRITIDAGIAQFSAHTEVNPQTWDAKAGRAVGKTKGTVLVNKTLDKLERQIRSHYSRMVSEDAYVTAESVKNALNGIGRKAANLLELFRKYNEEVKLKVGVNCVEATYEQYLMSYTHLSEFIRLRYHADDVELTSLNHSFINAYDLYLRIDKRMSAYTVQKHITSLRRMIRRAIRQNTLKRNPFSNYISERPLQQRRHLTMDEFQKLLNKPIAETHLIRTRDIFLFACFTGMAYADIRNLSEKHLITDENGFMWIKIKRQKTNSECNIRLLNVPVQIIEKYRHERRNEKIFELTTLVHINRNLKKIASSCGIEKNLTFHMARHTFATQVCLSQGVPIETLSKMMGHDSVHTTQIYAKITNQKVNEDMKILSNRIESKYSMPKDDVPKNFARNQYYK